MSTNDNIEDLFRKRFENKESPVSGRVWENIKKTLPPENNNRRPGFPSYLAGALLIGFIVAGWFFFRGEDASDSSVITSENSLKNGKEETGSGKEQYKDQLGMDNQNMNGENAENLSDQTASDFLNHPESSEDISEEDKKTAGDSNRNTEKNLKDLTKTDTNNGKLFAHNHKQDKQWEEEKKSGKNNTGGARTNENDKVFIAVENNKSENPENASEGKTFHENKGDLENNPGREESNNPFTDERNGSDKNNTDKNDDIKQNKDHSTFNDNSNPENYVNNTSFENRKHNTIVISDSNNYSGNPIEEDVVHNQVNDETPDKTLAKNTSSEKDSSLTSPAEEDSTEVKDHEAPKDTLSEENVKKDEEKKEKIIHLSADLFGSPSLTYRFLSGNTEKLGNRNDLESSKLNLGGGIRINVGLSDKVSVNGGIGVVSYGENYQYTHEEVRHITTYQYDTIWTQDTATWYYYVTKDSFTTETRTKTTHNGKNSYRYLEIPFSATYVISTGKFRLGITGGISANILLSAYTSRMELSAGSATHQLIEQRSGSNSPFRSVTFGAFINPTIVYHLKDNWAVFAEPGFKFLLSSVYKKEENISLKPYGMNLSVGLRYIIR